MPGGQIKVHFPEAKGFVEKEIISEDGRVVYKDSLMAKLCAHSIVWHLHGSPGLPMHEFHKDQ